MRTHGRWSMRCSRSRGESCTSQDTACRAARTSPAASCSRAGPFSDPTKSATCAQVPELVFVNCCHLASGDADQLLNYDRASFASGVAGALIEIGVRCVIAAGWAVDDDAASVFAETFYGSLLRGSRFIDAVGDARKAAYERTAHVNTWAAYQCYGDPDWVFRRKAPDPNQFTAPSVEDFSGVASAQSLKLALERIVVETKFQGADVVQQLTNLTHLEKLFGSKVGKERRRGGALRRGIRRGWRCRDRNAVVRAGRHRAGWKGLHEGGGATRQRPRSSRLGDRRQGEEASRRHDER